MSLLDNHHYGKPMRNQRFIVTAYDPDDPGLPYITTIASQAQVEDLQIAAEHAGVELSVHRPTAVGTVLQWMNKRRVA